MAISTNYTLTVNLQQVVRVGFRQAGVLGAEDEPDPYQVAMAAEFINLNLKEWQAGNRMLRQIERVTKTLTAGTATVTVDADTIDIEFPAYVTSSTAVTNTYEVERMTLAEYMRISNKTQAGVPSQALVERKDTVVMTLYPVPNASVSSITYTRHKLIRNFEAGTDPDIQQRYVRALTLIVAVDAAEHYGKSADKIMRLTQQRDTAMNTMERDNAERGDIVFRL
jgi:hypothetical protein